MRKKLGTVDDQRTLLPLITEGRSYRECMRILDWTFGRVSEAARALKGVRSDSRDGRTLRAICVLSRQGRHGTVHRRIMSYAARTRIAS